jgi:hypothetical protein
MCCRRMKRRRRREGSGSIIMVCFWRRKQRGGHNKVFDQKRVEYKKKVVEGRGEARGERVAAVGRLDIVRLVAPKK